MGFRRFVKACRKYKFNYALSTHCEMTLILRPQNTFCNITLKQEDRNYKKLFKRAIAEMKLYGKH